ncbi:MAG: magnesium chelatase ATPase subunit I, partial [Pseudomonadota bacterium]
MRGGLMIAAVEPLVGGLLALGDRGTGKSTTIRALAALLPPMQVIEGCRYGCDPAQGCGEPAGCTVPDGKRRSHAAP